MSRTKRARSPAAEHEVELHSPTRRRISHNKPRVHARPLACAYDSSDDDQHAPSTSDDDEDESELILQKFGIEIAFEDPMPSGTPAATQLPPTPSQPLALAPLSAASDSEATVADDTAHEVAAYPTSPRSPSPAAPQEDVLAIPSPAVPSPPTTVLTSVPRPEPIADRLRRMAREGRAKLPGASSTQNASPSNASGGHAGSYTQPSARDDSYIQNNARLRQMIDDGIYGVYIDSGNNNIIRIADCVQNAQNDEDDQLENAPRQYHPTSVTKSVRVQPPPELR